jgi:hypothetical protein
MKSRIRNRTTALAIATVTGLASIGLAGSPAQADDAALGSSGSQASAASAEAQSVHLPTNAGDYADELVRAWGAGNMTRVEAFASAKVFAELSDHGSAHGTHWDYTGAEGAAGTIYVDYRNTVTGEKMTVGVANEASSNGQAHAVHSVRFDG